MMKERMRRRVEEQEKSIRDVRETTEDVESKGPMGYGGFPTNDCNNDSSSDGGSGSSDNGSDYASSECVSDYDSEFDYGSSSDDESDSENEQNAILYFLTSSVLQKPISCLYSSTNHRMS